ncbi:hypothetical protein, partial [Pseudomonas aeruginosa]|uniref:hypothetical protein n=1 Tax=Pseudomonas aeruginosa TaxID=287 RepID=UPI0011157472
MRQRDLKFTFVVGEGNLAFDVVEFELEEALCEPFRLNLKLASDKNAIDFKQVLDQPGTLIGEFWGWRSLFLLLAGVALLG